MYAVAANSFYRTEYFSDEKVKERELVVKVSAALRMYSCSFLMKTKIRSYLQGGVQGLEREGGIRVVAFVRVHNQAEFFVLPFA